MKLSFCSKIFKSIFVSWIFKTILFLFFFSFWFLFKINLSSFCFFSSHVSVSHFGSFSAQWTSLIHWIEIISIRPFLLLRPVSEPQYWQLFIERNFILMIAFYFSSTSSYNTLSSCCCRRKWKKNVAKRKCQRDFLHKWTHIFRNSSSHFFSWATVQTLNYGF